MVAMVREKPGSAGVAQICWRRVFCEGRCRTTLRRWGPWASLQVVRCPQLEDVLMLLSKPDPEDIFSLNILELIHVDFEMSYVVGEPPQ